MARKHLRDHTTSECPLQIVECPYKDCGCRWDIAVTWRSRVTNGCDCTLQCVVYTGRAETARARSDHPERAPRPHTSGSSAQHRYIGSHVDTGAAKNEEGNTESTGVFADVRLCVVHTHDDGVGQAEEGEGEQ